VFVQDQVRKIKEAWPHANLELDEENRALYENMKKRGKIKVIDWEECKKQFEPEHSTFFSAFTQLYNEGGEFHTEMKNAAEKYFSTVSDKQKNKPQFRVYREKRTDSFIIERYIKYLLEEAAMMAAWDECGILQMGYPCDRNEISVEVYAAIFKAIQIIRERLPESAHKPDTTLQLLNIKIKEQQSPLKKPTSRKGSLEPASTALLQKENYIGKLKLKIRGLQENLAKAEKQKIGPLQHQIEFLETDVLFLQNQSADYFRSLVHMEDHSGHLNDVVEKQDKRIAELERTAEEKDEALHVQQQAHENAMKEALHAQQQAHEKVMQEALHVQQQTHENAMQEALHAQQQEHEKAMEEALHAQQQAHEKVMQEALQKNQKRVSGNTLPFPKLPRIDSTIRTPIIHAGLGFFKSAASSPDFIETSKTGFGFSPEEGEFLPWGGKSHSCPMMPALSLTPERNDSASPKA
jgi:hypothetical protein